VRKQQEVAHVVFRHFWGVSDESCAIVPRTWTCRCPRNNFDAPFLQAQQVLKLFGHKLDTPQEMDLKAIDHSPIKCFVLRCGMASLMLPQTRFLKQVELHKAGFDPSPCKERQFEVAMGGRVLYI